jgi:hypothetical protein
MLGLVGRVMEANVTGMGSGRADEKDAEYRFG